MFKINGNVFKLCFANSFFVSVYYFREICFLHVLVLLFYYVKRFLQIKNPTFKKLNKTSYLSITIFTLLT